MPTPELARNLYEDTALERDKWHKRALAAERQLAEAREALNRIARGAELQAHVMRDPLRTGGWDGSEKVADAFDDIAVRARAALQDRAPSEQDGG